MKFTVAIDGPAAAGKGTISKLLAERFGFAHLDTGLIYRATGARVLSGEDPVEVAGSLREEDLRRQDLRTPEVAQAASKVAAMPDVRAALLEFQKQFARREGGAVLDGRDIGTVICPDAEAKLFVTATEEVRAKRRYEELTSKGMNTTFQKVLTDLKARDERDATRDVAPMKPAADALLLDTSQLSISDAVNAAEAYVRRSLEKV